VDVSVVVNVVVMVQQVREAVMARRPGLVRDQGGGVKLCAVSDGEFQPWSG
jgi:hypothetical protein